MLSRRCEQRNRTIIPTLLSQHGAILSGDDAVVDLSTAENWLLQEEMVQKMSGTHFGISGAIQDLSYSEGIGGSPKARERIAAIVNKYFSPATSVAAEHIVLAAGGSYALEALVEQICDPGDAILIAAPYWAGLDLSLSIHNNARVEPVHIPLDCFFDVESVKYYQDALEKSSVPVKAVLVCNPHNPLGKCYSRQTLDSMLEFCRRNNLHYISDEVYALSLHDIAAGQNSSPGFVSALSLANGNELVHVVYSLSKDFGSNGIRLGAFISQKNNAVRLSGALSAHQQTSSIATSFAITHILNEETVELVMNVSGKKLRSAYQIIRQFLLDRKLAFVEVDSGMFVFAKLCAADDLDTEKTFNGILKRSGVVLSSGTSYHFDRPGWYRICYAVQPVLLKEGLQRIDRALHELDNVMAEK
ncbi:aminotransferase GliI [Lepidopterella palustris CBS 459.81]|uniref:Aminotransferase GliI n=1 Tax=Lepidopterella palustris CBS 459.81 TaxID=1314670 RepID=A0A8E2ELC8_9PEZI|nr:aminotransferase GliI [Lepidopterella palustris CBS 459.81]